MTGSVTTTLTVDAIRDFEPQNCSGWQLGENSKRHGYLDRLTVPLPGVALRFNAWMNARRFDCGKDQPIARTQDRVRAKRKGGASGRNENPPRQRDIGVHIRSMPFQGPRHRKEEKNR